MAKYRLQFPVVGVMAILCALAFIDVSWPHDYGWSICRHTLGLGRRTSRVHPTVIQTWGMGYRRRNIAPELMVPVICVTTFLIVRSIASTNRRNRILGVIAVLLCTEVLLFIFSALFHEPFWYEIHTYNVGF